MISIAKYDKDWCMTLRNQFSKISISQTVSRLNYILLESFNFGLMYSIVSIADSSSGSMPKPNP